ncbi:hypothetical protein [Planktotalea sp.]|uniref:hypothetical protein n=1 Tax=Planktotalea sp. TaxID=2029877 RepID=UPI0025FB1ECE|nr:hypothetical protein [Planktotalea sp.]
MSENEWEVPKPIRPTFSTPIKPSDTEGNPQQNEYYDLRAQERMAHATDWIAWITLVSSTFAVFGVGLLIWNLSAAREANKIARTIGQAQNRAYIAHMTGGDATPVAEVFQNEIHTCLTFVNRGFLPAKSLSYSGIVRLTLNGTMVFEENVSDFHGDLITQSDVLFQHKLDVKGSLWPEVLKEKSFIEIVGIAMYGDGFDNRCQTAVGFKTWIKGPAKVSNAVTYIQGENHNT